MITDRNGLYSVLACVSQKTRKLYGPEKPFERLRPAYSVKLVFFYVVKEIKIKITAKFCDTEHFRFEDTKRIMSPKKFRVFRETGLWYHYQLYSTQSHYHYYVRDTITHVVVYFVLKSESYTTSHAFSSNPSNLW